MCYVKLSRKRPNFEKTKLAWTFRDLNAIFTPVKKKKKMARPGFKPTISRSEVNRANHWSLDEKIANLLSNIHCDETKSEFWPVQILVIALPE